MHDESKPQQGLRHGVSELRQLQSSADTPSKYFFVTGGAIGGGADLVPSLVIIAKPPLTTRRNVVMERYFGSRLNGLEISPC